MASLTYFVALPFVPDDYGKVVPGKAHECVSASSAVKRAQSMATAHPGAIAFSRTGDPSTGEFENAEVLQTFGIVPTEDILMGYER